jgi:hypothetical protein
VQRSWACGQRGAKRHPSGRSNRAGGVPSIEYSFSTRSSILGTEAINAWVYGWAGWLNSLRTVPCSTIRPA